jgi:hypothetical protein
VNASPAPSPRCLSTGHSVRSTRSPSVSRLWLPRPRMCVRCDRRSEDLWSRNDGWALDGEWETAGYDFDLAVTTALGGTIGRLIAGGGTAATAAGSTHSAFELVSHVCDMKTECLGYSTG